MTPREQAEKIWAGVLVPRSQQDAFEAAMIDSITAALESERAKVERLREAAKELVRVTSGNHSVHWDSTMQGGVGCEQCARELLAREAVRTALKETT